MFGNKKLRGLVSLLVIAITILSACAPSSTPEVIEKEVVVEKLVVETVVVEKEVVVEKPVVETVVVEKEVVVEKPVVETVIVEVVVTPTPSGEPKRGGTLVVGFRNELAGMDPHKHSHINVVKTVAQQIFNTLVEYNEELEVVPALAESWEQPDDTTFVFHLREGVRFHDGSEMTAEDVKFSLDRARAEETASPWKGLFKSIDEVTVRDPLTVVVKLEEPSAPMLDYFAHVGASIVPKPVFDSVTWHQTHGSLGDTRLFLT